MQRTSNPWFATRRAAVMVAVLIGSALALATVPGERARSGEGAAKPQAGNPDAAERPALDPPRTTSSAPGSLGAHSPPIGADVSQVLRRELPSNDRTAVALGSLAGKRGIALVFISTECPISNGYIPTLNRLATTYAEQGLALVLLNPNDGQSLKDLAAHAKEFEIAMPALKDAGAAVARDLGATRCPEAVVIDAAGKLVYRGRIDDRFSRRGGPAGKVTRSDLADALDQWLAGKPVAVAETETVGCPIVAKSAAARTGTGNASTQAAVTWADQIASLVEEHCQKCHRSGGVGPFSLTSYDQAASWADDIRAFTADRTMPPWLPADGYGEFHNRRALSEEQIALIGKWVDAGCPSGDLSKRPATPLAAVTWTLGEPDLILEPAEEYRLAADGNDVYRCFVLPTGLTEDVFVKAIEVLPGNSRVVHHVIAFLDTTDASAKLDARDPGAGYSTTAGFPGFLPSGGLGGWAPGNLPRRLPDGMGKPLPTGAKIVMQVHYHKSGKSEADRTKLGLYLSGDETITRAVRSIPVLPLSGRFSMKIPADDPSYEVRGSITLPRDVMAIVVTPHMHLIGKDMKLTATLPDGSEKPMIWVKGWDFNWQESYQYREPVALPAGTKLDLVAHFDNSAENPRNPNSPPKLVRWGEQTTDEMCIAFLEVAPKDEAKSPEDLKLQRPGELMQEALRAKAAELLRQRLRGSRSQR